MRGRGIASMCVLVGCGRLGFDATAVDDGGIDAADAPTDTNLCVASPVDVPSWPMPNDPQSIGLPNVASRVVVGDRVVDQITGLEWQRSISSTAVTWDEAVAYCASLQLDGGCWRLPERIELASIVNYSIHTPSIDPLFATTPASDFWTNTVFARNTTNRWGVRFDVGYLLDRSLDTTALVRCVRGAQAVPPARFEITTDTVYDNATSLEWQRAVVGTYTWADAQAYCSQLALDGGSWRSPSIQELETIVDTTIGNGVVIDATAFPGTPGSMFWSGNEIQTDANQGWTIDFSAGFSFRPISSLLPTRCVR